MDSISSAKPRLSGSSTSSKSPCGRLVARWRETHSPCKTLRENRRPRPAPGPEETERCSRHHGHRSGRCSSSTRTAGTCPSPGPARRHCAPGAACRPRRDRGLLVRPQCGRPWTRRPTSLSMTPYHDAVPNLADAASIADSNRLTQRVRSRSGGGATGIWSVRLTSENRSGVDTNHDSPIDARSHSPANSLSTLTYWQKGSRVETRDLQPHGVEKSYVFLVRLQYTLIEQEAVDPHLELAFAFRVNDGAPYACKGLSVRKDDPVRRRTVLKADHGQI